MIQLTGNGLVASDQDEVARLAETFARVHCVKLERFLDEAILQRLTAAVEHATFVPRVHDEIDPPRD